MRASNLQLAIKRGIDATAGVSLLVLGAPLLLLLAALVRVSSPGPVLYSQLRAGHRGRPFRIYKFRSMREASAGEQALVWTNQEAARVTAIGGFMRDYGLDELPQAWNILKGDMSIIGPRPPLLAQAETFTPRERTMFEMRPGVLSLAAIRGRRSLSPEQRREDHVEYVERWSLLLDLNIFWRSASVVLGRRDARDVVADGDG